MDTETTKHAMALGAGGMLVTGALAIATASPPWAMPAPSNTAAVKIAASNPITDVRYYRRGYYRHGYYGHGYYGRGYGRGYYGRGYGYPWWGNPDHYAYAYPYSYSYPYYFPYPYSYSYSYPGSVDYGWGWGGW